MKGSNQPRQPHFAAGLPGVIAGYRLQERSQFAVARESIGFPRWKRLLDVTLVVLTLPFLLTLMILIMSWIKIVSRGPVFYRQQRIGYQGARFFIFKFRTMRVNAETHCHESYFEQLMRADCPMTKLDSVGDRRLIFGGKVLRASGLDELPQIFNILQGDMSLVGPRPCTPHEFQRYESWQKERVTAPPGLTGYWQVNGKNRTTFNEMIALDMFYAKNMSPWLDLAIILKTGPVLIAQVLEGRIAAWRKRRQSVTRQLTVAGKDSNGSTEMSK